MVHTLTHDEHPQTSAMHLNHRLEAQSVGASIRNTGKAGRRSEFPAVLHLQGIEEFGIHIHRRVLSCHSAGLRPAVILLAVDALQGGLAYGELLSALGARVRSRVRSTDQVARIGDRFGVYLDGNVATHAAAIRERLNVALVEEFGFGGMSGWIRPRFGVAIHPGTPVSGIGLVMQAAQGIEASLPDAGLTAVPGAAEALEPSTS